MGDGDLILGLETKELMLATMFIAAIIATSAAIAGDVMQDLKTGHGWATRFVNKQPKLLVYL